MKEKKIVILHGWQSKIERWKPVKQELERLGWFVYLPQLPGFNKVKIIKPWTLTDYCQWLGQYLKQSRLTSYYILGHSFGGSLGIKLASLKPLGLKGLILVNSAGIRHRITVKKVLFYIIAKSGKAFFSIPPFSALRRMANCLIYKLAREQDYYSASPVMKETMKNILKEDLQGLLSKINTSTLIIWGEKDKTTPLKDGLMLKKKIAKSQLIVYDDCGHGLPFEKTKLLAQKVDNFYQNA